MKYKVKQGCSIRRNRKIFDEGSILDLSESEAQAFIDVNVLELLPHKEVVQESLLPPEPSKEEKKEEVQKEEVKPVKATKKKTTKKKSTTKKKEK